jgi:hypothetical protein
MIPPLGESREKANEKTRIKGYFVSSIPNSQRSEYETVLGRRSLSGRRIQRRSNSSLTAVVFRFSLIWLGRFAARMSRLNQMQTVLDPGVCHMAGCLT